MRIIVVSDTHEIGAPLLSIIRKNPDADLFLHLGDGWRDVQNARLKFPEIDLRMVRGNGDVVPEIPQIATVHLEGHRILYTHGSHYGVNYSLENLKALALENQVDIVLFGHTHIRHSSYENGVYFLNPGSASLPRDGKPPSYGWIDLTEAGVVTNIVDLENPFGRKHDF